MMRSESFDFSEIKPKVEHVRALGNFVADLFTLCREEVRSCEHVEVDKWLKEIQRLCF
jgi:hypothetical protein